MLIPLPPFPHCVYVAHRADLTAAYVGVTSHLFNRLYQHSVKDWWPGVKSISVESFATRAEADAREAELIATLRTDHNHTGNPRELLKEVGVTAAEVRAFIDAHKASEAKEVPLGMVTLRQFAERDDVPYSLPALRLHSNRYVDQFPTPQGTGASNAKLYRLTDLFEWMAVKRGDGEDG